MNNEKTPQLIQPEPEPVKYGRRSLFDSTEWHWWICDCGEVNVQNLYDDRRCGCGAERPEPKEAT